MQLRTLFLALCLALPAYSANFALVQHTNGSGSLTQAFTSSNTAGDAIIVIVYLFSGSPTVSDSNSNTYTKISHGSLLDVWAATGIIAGSNTVTVTTGAGGAYAMEFSSTNPTYFVTRACPGAGTISNSGGGGCTAFTSSSEVMVVFAATTTGSATPYSSSSGTFTLNTTMPFDFTTAVAAGWDDQTSMTGSYVNTISYAGGPGPAAGDREGVFINLGGGGGGATHVFPIIY